eukprot:scaffold30825_cov172-Isochrysis_galbana.AAC.2
MSMGLFQHVGGRLILHGLPHGPNEALVLPQGRTHPEAFQHGDAHVVHASLSGSTPRRRRCASR